MKLLHYSCPSILVLLVLLQLANALPSQLVSDAEECSNYCFNSGICRMVDDAPQCVCLPGWEGQRCDIVRKFTRSLESRSLEFAKADLRSGLCALMPNLCLNGGICYQDATANKLACQCPMPFAGNTCQRLSICATNLCLNGGVCSEKPDDETSMECKCQDGTTGTFCETFLTTTTTESPSTTSSKLCEYMPKDYCKNGGFCVVVSGQLRCQCPATYTGAECDIPLGGPLPPTQGPQTTRPAGGSTLFTTRPPVTGPVGSTQPPVTGPGGSTQPPVTGPFVGACATNPCQNGAPCYNNGNDYYCFCGTRFTGRQCQSLAG